MSSPDPDDPNLRLGLPDLKPDPAVRSFIGQPTTPSALPLSVRTNSDLIHCSSTGNSSRQSVSFHSDKHAEKVLLAVNRLRKSEKLCDVSIKVGEKNFTCHKNVLAGSCPYFDAMFASEMVETKMQEIQLHEISADAMELLIDYCYTAQITIEEGNVQQLLPAACLLQMTEIQHYCCEFLSKQLDPTNCLGIRAFADTHHCSELLNISSNYCAQHFEEVASNEEFKNLPLDQLIKILASDELNVSSEEEVYRAAMEWISHDLLNRKNLLSTVLKNVRFPLMSPVFLVGTCSNSQLIKADEESRDYVDEAKNYLLLPQERGRMQGPRTRPRRPVNPYEFLFAVGGWCSGDAIQTVERYDPVREEWSMVASMNKRRCGVGVAVLDNNIYAIGGHDGTSYLQTVEKFDPNDENAWSPVVAPTSTCRTSVGVAVLQGYLYAIGGQDGSSCLDLVERYDHANNKWERKASMKTRRLGVGVAVLNEYVYAVGGSDGGKPWDTVERYNPKNDTWQKVCAMSTARKHLGCAVYNDHIYAVGGRDDCTELNSVERYSDTDDRWTPVVAMQMKRSGVGLAVVGGQLLAVGGFDGLNYLKSVEILDSENGSWRMCSGKGNMHYRRLGGGVGVVKLQNPFSFVKKETTRQMRDWKALPPTQEYNPERTCNELGTSLNF